MRFTAQFPLVSTLVCTPKNWCDAPKQNHSKEACPSVSQQSYQQWNSSPNRVPFVVRFSATHRIPRRTQRTAEPFYLLAGDGQVFLSERGSFLCSVFLPHIVPRDKHGAGYGSNNHRLFQSFEVHVSTRTTLCNMADSVWDSHSHIIMGDWTIGRATNTCM